MYNTSHYNSYLWGAATAIALQGTRIPNRPAQPAQPATHLHEPPGPSF